MSNVPPALAAIDTATAPSDAFTPGTADYVTLLAAVTSAETIIQAEEAAAETIIAGVVTAAASSGAMLPPSIYSAVSTIGSLVVAAGNLANLHVIDGYVGQIEANLLNASP